MDAMHGMHLHLSARPTTGRLLITLAITGCLLPVGCRAPQRAQPRPADRVHYPASARAEFPSDLTHAAQQTVPPSVSEVDTVEAEQEAVSDADALLEDWEVTPLTDEIESTATDATASEPAVNEVILTTEDEALEWLEQIGANVTRDYDEDNVVALDLAFLRVADNQLQVLTFFPHLREVDLTGTDVSDIGLEMLPGMQRLESLKLRGTALTDAGLPAIAGLQQLKILDLSRTQVTDEGLSLLIELPELRYLLLNHTSVSDAGLQVLSKMSGLRGINLIGTAASREGIALLQSRMPDCVIISATSEDLSSVRPPDTYQPADAADPDISAVDRQRNQQFRRLVTMAAEQPELADHFASVCASNGRWSEAAQILSEMDERLPGDLKLKHRLAEALVHSGNTDEALALLTPCHGEAIAHQKLGAMVYRQALAESEKHLQRSLELDPNNSESRRQMQLLRLQVFNSSNIGTPLVESEISDWMPEVQPGNHDIEDAKFSRIRISREPQLPSWQQPRTHAVGWQGQPDNFASQPVPGFIRQ
jgi:tetratricopeptide (TPR) repeat protein